MILDDQKARGCNFKKLLQQKVEKVTGGGGAAKKVISLSQIFSVPNFFETQISFFCVS